MPILTLTRTVTLRSRLTVFAVLACTAVASAHAVHPEKPATGPSDWHELWRAWPFDPLVIACIVLPAWLYGRGVRMLWAASRPGGGIRRWEAAAYAAGILALAVALVSPIHPWGEVLFSVHMTQHELLMVVAAPLIILGRPTIAFLRALPPTWAQALVHAMKTPAIERLWRAISRPVSAWGIHAVALWVWHLPVLFEAAVHNEWIHALQHLCFFLSALLFWYAVMSRPGAMSCGLAVLYQFTTALHSGLLGALLTFAGRAFYPSYVQTSGVWGLTALEDQQLGGLIMWIPAGLAYVVAGLALFAAWLAQSDVRQVARAELQSLPNGAGS